MNKMWKLAICLLLLAACLPRQKAAAATCEISTSDTDISLYEDEKSDVCVQLYKDGMWVGDDSDEATKLKVDNSNDKVCKITVKDETIEVVALQAGECDLTLRFHKAREIVHVTVKEDEILCSSIPVDARIQLFCRGIRWSSEEVQYTVNDKSIAKIVDDKYITGLKEGKVTVTAKLGKKSLSKEVEVIPELKLKLKDYKVIEKNRKKVGVELDVQNDSSEAVKILAAAYLKLPDTYCNLQSFNGIRIGSGKNEAVSCDTLGGADFFDSHGKLNKKVTIVLRVKYCGESYGFYFNEDGTIDNNSWFYWEN